MSEEQFDPERVFCKYEKQSKDKRYPVDCLKDNTYATRIWCNECKRMGFKKARKA